MATFVTNDALGTKPGAKCRHFLRKARAAFVQMYGSAPILQHQATNSSVPNVFGSSTRHALSNEGCAGCGHRRPSDRRWRNSRRANALPAHPAPAALRRRRSESRLHLPVASRGRRRPHKPGDENARGTGRRSAGCRACCRGGDRCERLPQVVIVARPPTLGLNRDRGLYLPTRLFFQDQAGGRDGRKKLALEDQKTAAIGNSMHSIVLDSCADIHTFSL